MCWRRLPVSRGEPCARCAIPLAAPPGGAPVGQQVLQVQPGASCSPGASEHPQPRPLQRLPLKLLPKPASRPLAGLASSLTQTRSVCYVWPSWRPWKLQRLPTLRLSLLQRRGRQPLPARDSPARCPWLLCWLRCWMPGVSAQPSSTARFCSRHTQPWPRWRRQVRGCGAVVQHAMRELPTTSQPAHPALTAHCHALVAWGEELRRADPACTLSGTHTPGVPGLTWHQSAGY